MRQRLIKDKVAEIMFEKKVLITDDALIIGNTKVLWENIVGIREQDDPLLRKVSSQFPRAEIFLKGGKIIIISNSNNFKNQSSITIDPEEDIFQFIMAMIKKKANKESLQDKTWFEWRLLVTIVFIEFVVLLGSIWNNQSFEKTTIALISGGLFGAAIGWIWERQARKKRYSVT